VTHKRVPWDQIHVFRLVDGEILEHWAVRDDYAMVEALVGAGPWLPRTPILLRTKVGRSAIIGR
jgi:hypothetical protein